MFVSILSVNVSDPYFNLAAVHFNRLLKVYGSPIIVLNLVKVGTTFSKGERQIRYFILPYKSAGSEGLY